MCNETLRTRLIFPRWTNLRGHMPRFTLKMNVFPSIFLETPYMCDETLRTGLVFLKIIDLGVTYLGLLEKWMFSHLSPWKPHECVMKPSEQGWFSPRWFDFGSHIPRFTWKNECFPIYLLGNPINVCWNPQNRVQFFWDNQFEESHA